MPISPTLSDNNDSDNHQNKKAENTVDNAVGVMATSPYIQLESGSNNEFCQQHSSSVAITSLSQNSKGYLPILSP